MRTAVLVVLSFFLLSLTAAAQEAPRKLCAAQSQLPHFAVPHVAVSFELPKAAAQKAKLRPFNFTDEYKVKVDCTGTECGCDAELEACLAECPPLGEDGHTGCVATCNLHANHCGVCCCCEWPYCPPYCS